MTRRLFLKKSSLLISMMLLSKSASSSAMENLLTRSNDTGSSVILYGKSLYNRLNNPSKTVYLFDPTRSHYAKASEVKKRVWTVVDGHVELKVYDW